MEWFRTSTTLDWKNMLQKRIPSFPGQSVNLWFVFFEIPVKLTQTATPPPPPKKHYFKLQTPPHPLYPPTLAPTIQELFYKKHGTMYQDLMSQIATGHQLKPRRIPQHSFDCLAMLLDESLVIWVCLKLKESPQQLIQAFLSLSGHLYIQCFIFGGRSYFIYFCQMLFMRPSFANLKYMNTYTPSNLTQTTTISPEKNVLAKNI